MIFDDVKDNLVASVRAGASIEDASRHVGVSVHTVRGWLAKGRKGVERYAAFAAVVDEHRVAQRLPDRAVLRGLTREELEGLLAEKVRAGSVPAMRLWFDLHRAEFEGRVEEDDPFAEFDPPGYK